jgi:hypothetical protein
LETVDVAFCSCSVEPELDGGEKRWEIADLTQGVKARKTVESLVDGNGAHTKGRGVCRVWGWLLLARRALCACNETTRKKRLACRASDETPSDEGDQHDKMVRAVSILKEPEKLRDGPATGTSAASIVQLAKALF